MRELVNYIYFLNFGLLLIVHQAICVVRFIDPYFLIKNNGDTNNPYIAVSTSDCLAGAYSNADVPLTEFCVTGVWLITDSPCADDDSDRYIVSGKDSCFKIDTSMEIKVKRFLPLMQNMSDFEGYAFAFPNNLAYFVQLNPDNRTEMRPLSQPRSEWNILTVNFGTYGRYLNEFTANDGGKMGSRTCYKTQPEFLTQVYTMSGDGSTVFYSYRDNMECMAGFNKFPQNYSLQAGTIRNLKDGTIINSTSSYRRLDLQESQVRIPFPSDPVTGACSDDKVNHPNLTLRLPNDLFPLFPHLQPPSFMDDIISDEIQATAQAYMDNTLYQAPIPKINRTEYKYIVSSTIGLAKFCCSDSVKYADLVMFRKFFRLTYTYFAQYYPYEELKDVEQETRILDALGQCMNQSGTTEQCITVNKENGTCNEEIESTTFNGTIYNKTEIFYDIVFEIGNLDFVSEIIWKSGLFVHYFCSPYFELASDHSAFYSKLESFFSPLAKKKWTQPKGVHRIYELLLSGVDFKGLATTVDACVATAKQINYDPAQYNRWLSRPGTFNYEVRDFNRTKRAIRPWRKASRDAGTRVGNGGRASGGTGSGTAGNCSPPNAPKLFCLNQQFEVFDKKLVFPPQASATARCSSISQKKQGYKYIHASTFGTSF